MSSEVTPEIAWRNSNLALYTRWEENREGYGLRLFLHCIQFGTLNTMFGRHFRRHWIPNVYCHELSSIMPWPTYVWLRENVTNPYLKKKKKEIGDHSNLIDNFSTRSLYKYHLYKIMFMRYQSIKKEYIVCSKQNERKCSLCLRST